MIARTLKRLMVIFLYFSVLPGWSQSIEFLPGTARLFADVQFLEPLDDQYRFTVFSRTRATLSYDNDSDLLSAAYFNYTSSTGLGASVLGSISSSNGGAYGAGLNYFKSQGAFSIFALLAVSIKNDPDYELFSIVRYRPKLSERWKLYSSLEIYSNVKPNLHQYSVQRARLGLQRGQIQFGAGVNLAQAGPEFITDHNAGIFLRIEPN